MRCEMRIGFLGILEHRVDRKVYANEPFILVNGKLKKVDYDYIDTYKPIHNYKKGEMAEFIKQPIMGLKRKNRNNINIKVSKKDFAEILNCIDYRSSYDSLKDDQIEYLRKLEKKIIKQFEK
jgi:hypothetical protein